MTSHLIRLIGVAMLFMAGSLKADSRIAYTSEITGNGDIYVMDADGSNQLRLTDDPAYDAGPTWSPDGARIAFLSTRSGNGDIYVINADGSNLELLISHEAMDFWPDWSPDGSRIVFASWRDGQGEIYVINVDGSDLHRLTDTPGSDEDFPAWSPDGARIVFCRIGEGTYLMDADGSNVQALASITTFELDWSPNGEQIAFGSDYQGFRAIYVIDTDGTNLQRLSAAYHGENGPDWSSDGTKFAFASWGDGDGEIYVMNADGTNRQRLTSNGAHDEFPAWEPSPVEIPCCSGRVGNANGQGTDEPTISDVSVMVDAKFITGTCDGIIDCLAEADINQSGGADPTCEDVTISDISILIDYLFITGESLGLADCL